MRGNLYILFPARTRTCKSSFNDQKAIERGREKRDRDGGRGHLIKRFECPNQQQSALSRVRKTALLPPSSSSSGSDAMIRPLEPPPPPSRAPRTTQHTRREGGATNGGSIRGQRESPKGPVTNDVSREGGGGLTKF